MNNEQTENFVVDVELSLTAEELLNFSKLAKLINKDVPQTYRLCARERCEELLNVLQQEPEDPVTE